MGGTPEPDKVFFIFMDDVWMTCADHPNYEASRSGSIRNKLTMKIKKYSLNTNGYCLVCLWVGYSRSFSVARIIAKTFLIKPYGFDEVNHIDGNKLNNSVENLEWSNRSLNMLHAWNNGLRNRKYKPRKKNA